MYFLETQPTPRKTIFLDELPWLDTPQSGFISALEHFWNSWASYRSDVLLIVCGSAASWIINELINNRGGLHNRLTERIILKPFSISETETFLQEKGGNYDRYQLLELYMVNICEMKFSIKPYVITKAYADNLRNKMMVFRTETDTTKTLFLTIIAANGLAENQYSQNMVQDVLDMNALFD
jgi:hypothetical protein